MKLAKLTPVLLSGIYIYKSTNSEGNYRWFYEELICNPSEKQKQQNPFSQLTLSEFMMLLLLLCFYIMGSVVSLLCESGSLVLKSTSVGGRKASIIPHISLSAFH